MPHRGGPRGWLVDRTHWGAVLGLGAAVLFGISTPLAKQLVGEVRPQLLAGLLYTGAAIVLSLLRTGSAAKREARLRRTDVPALLVVTAFGGVAAPVLLLVGLERVTGVAASLMLNLEAVFTLLLALAVFGEHLGRKAAWGAAAVTAGAAVLGVGGGESRADWIGIGCVALACLCWAIDNNLTQRLSGRDPFSIVRVKATVAGLVNIGLAVVLGAVWPGPIVVVSALALGGAAYGLSVLLDAYALRYVGAARESAYFGTAPAFGVLGSILVLGERVDVVEATAIVAMALGVYLLLTERHDHLHPHEALQHDHVHRHDDGHHVHHHGSPVEVHSHPHVHAQLTHAHAHVSDVHHRHDHH